MSKAYLLVICLLSASLTGCLGGEDDDDEIIIDPIVSKPTATIVSINPNPANLTSLENIGVTFVGNGETKNGYILEYDWGSSIDGFLSSEKTFTTKNLSLGEHTIFFKVLNDEKVWSEKATTVLSVVNNTDNNEKECELVPYGHCSGAELPHTDLSEMNLTGIDLSYANLTSANLTGAILHYTNFTDAIVTDANFTDTHWYQTIWTDGVIYNTNTNLHYGIFEVWSVNGNFAPDPNQDESVVMDFVEIMMEDPLQFEQEVNNVSWRSYEHNFFIESNWESTFIILLLSVDYSMGGGMDPSEGPAGTLNLSIMDPNGVEHAEGYEVVTWSNEIDERPYILPVISGTWTITISGSGLEGVGSILYYGDYLIRVESDKLE